MTLLAPQEQTYLLSLARSVIEGKLRGGRPEPTPANPSGAMVEKRGCFVTIHANGALRGCIGTIEPLQPLVEAVAENAINAAFRDPRFPPLAEKELASISLEISVLTVPEPLSFSNGDELVCLLKPGVHGVVLEKGWHRSTFLPQVWEQLPEPERFLSRLCQKAGLSGECWRDPGLTVKTYEVFCFSESPG
ncbi:MAG: AmmeMemoRadiSam system protein A [Desulfococcaceae bacterium]